jgi:hypothetical protein
MEMRVTPHLIRHFLLYPTAHPWSIAACALWVVLALFPSDTLGQAQGPLEPRAADASGFSAESGDLVAIRIPDNLAIDLDGRLDEEAWSLATPISDFTQQYPVEGGTPSERTEIRVVFNGDELYIGAMLYDDPSGILAYQLRRDAGLGTDDRFMWILDTFLDGRTGYFFEINAAGLMGDGLITGGGGGGGGGGRMQKSWDGIWETRVSRRPDGWSAEIRIPFRTLNFDPNLDSWGINFQRTIRRRQEEILWRGYRRNQGVFRPIHAGRVTGLRDLSQGIGLEAKPYAVGNWRNQPADADPTTYPGDVGIDVGYSVTPSLRAAVSVNTDFAEVEVDQRRVNLTRFPLRFPEQRDFFLEGSGVFSFAGRNGVEPYFSRDIGLVDGQPVPVNYGARLGGQAGKYELGFLQVGTGAVGADTLVGFDGSPTEKFTVARVKRSFLEQSTIGAIYTLRNSGAEATGLTPVDRHTAGVDLNYVTSRFFGDKNLQAEGFFVWNSNPTPTVDASLGNLTARGFRFDFPNDVWQAHVSYREFGHDYDPAVGFVPRNGFRRVEPRMAWRPLSNTSWIRRYSISAQYRRLSDLTTGIVEEENWDLNIFGFDFEAGDRWDIITRRVYEYLDQDFEIGSGVVIQPGAYTNWEWALTGGTANQRKVSGNFNFTRGGFWSGDRFAYTVGLTFRPNPGFSISTDVERNNVNLPEGDFEVDLTRLEAAWDINPWASISGNVQYDTQSEVVGFFGRAHWIVRPGNDLYVVYTSNWQNLGPSLFDRDLVTLSRGGSVKVNYTYRL